ncbi:hypothetical protein [Emticicia sp. 17c]|uniref:hypothetical protein n=1 Tax=Emticicia sp. 17c TaxID=3127704 RepID=UPI00301D4839
MRAKSIVLMLTLALYVFVSQMCTTNKEVAGFTTDPVVSVGHGALIGADGQEIKPEQQFIESAQKFYIDKLQKLAGQDKKATLKAEVERKQKDIYQLVDDKVLANALYLDWLIETLKPDNFAQLSIINKGLRWKYVTEIQKNPVLPDKDGNWNKGLRMEVITKLKGLGVSSSALTTVNNGEAYRKECLEAGVPVPREMFSGEWKFQGIIDNVFISRGAQAELWLYESESPKGVCLALPRYPIRDGKVSDNATLFGVICLGTNTGKACFFDNPTGKTFKRNVRVSFNEWVGGTDLKLQESTGGMCTDCHAGENPYVVHPDKPPFAGIIDKLKSPVWHDPLVDASWVHNPGPSVLLDAVDSDRKCTSCHTSRSAGRFPEVSNRLSGYCSMVLANAVGSMPIRTMPQGDLSGISFYMNHINALKNACGAAPGDPGVVVKVNPQEDPSFISPPIVFDPIYQCATTVAVRGVILNAKVNLYVNGTLVRTISPARDPDKTDFNGLPALRAGDKVKATQEFNGVVSGPSNEVTVKDYKADYPSGLPAPTIDPSLVYECANVIAVRHVPGANVTIYSNGGSPVTYIGGGSGWTIFSPSKRPFSVGDKFTAEISLCNDKSPISAPVTAIAAPASLGSPQFNPPAIIDGQELIALSGLTNGSVTTVTVTGAGSAKFTMPISYINNFDIATKIGRKLRAGDVMTAFQELCIKGPTTRTPEGSRCDALAAPKIAHPVVGSDVVVVTSSVPGARIRVYDGSGKEIGDGSGSIIKLSRKITGTDTLIVVQQVGECTSKEGYKVGVRNASDQKKGV